MSISAFLNSVDKLVEDENEEILNTVIDSYTEGDSEQETDEESIDVVPIKQHEAMQAVQLLQCYEEQQDDGSSDVARQLARLELSVRSRMSAGQRQASITSYFR
jgi:cytochrome c-type biogenesis protein CcmH/NrfF